MVNSRSVNECQNLKTILQTMARQYETPYFLKGDPSWFMHQVEGTLNQESMAFLASSLSFGQRSQFYPKIAFFLEKSAGKVHEWISCRHFHHDLPDNDDCYYRFYTNHIIYNFLEVYSSLTDVHGSLGNFVKCDLNGSQNAIDALSSICRFFNDRDVKTIVPRNGNSAKKRLCMFMRWMVRDHSPVDLGLWSSFIDKRTLIMPLDTHVVKEARRLGLFNITTPSFHSAKCLTNKLLQFFPDDPLKGDFALFGLGVNREVSPE